MIATNPVSAAMEKQANELRAHFAMLGAREAANACVAAENKSREMLDEPSAKFFASVAAMLRDFERDRAAHSGIASEL